MLLTACARLFASRVAACVFSGNPPANGHAVTGMRVLRCCRAEVNTAEVKSSTYTQRAPEVARGSWGGFSTLGEEVGVGGGVALTPLR